MRKTSEETTKTKKGKTEAISVLPVLLGVGLSMGLLFLLVLLTAVLVLGGILPAASSGLALSLAAGLSAFGGSRFAIGKGSGIPILTGGVIGAVLCLLLLLVCLCGRGELAFHGQFIGTLLMALAGGGFAGLLGKGKKKPKKKKK